MRSLFISSGFVRFVAVRLISFARVLSLFSICFGFILLIISAINSNSKIDFLNSPLFAISMLLVGFGISTWLFQANTHYKKYTRINFSKEHTVTEMSDLISHCKKSLIIFSGEFHSSVFDKHQILRVFEGLPIGITVQFYYSAKELDQKSEKFLKIASDRGWLFVQVPLKKQSHFIVVDDCHIRLEHSLEDNAEPQYASYHYFRPDFADHCKETFRNNVLRKDNEFNPMDLPL